MSLSRATATTFHPDDLKGQAFDVLIVGTGMGGATLGYMLAKKGMRVLFCEQGPPTHVHAFRGDFADQLLKQDDTRELRGRKLGLAGRSTQPILDFSNSSRTKMFTPFVGMGSGGSTSLYGGILERFSPHDFDVDSSHLDRSDDPTSRRWPVSFEEMLPYYVAAEKLFGIGVQDAPFSNERMSVLAKHLQQQGLNPYRLPVANRRDESCHGCQGFLCARGCKIDSVSACLLPAIVDHGAILINDCRVIKLLADKSSVTSILAEIKGKEIRLEAETIVLAAGALETPRLLLQSASDLWPQGIANSSGQVGRNLMRHYIDLYALNLPGSDAACNPKELGFHIPNATNPSHRKGSVQSFGAMPPVAAMLEELRESAEARPFVKAMLNAVTPILGRLYQSFFKRRTIMAAIMEDLPYPDNRVYLGSRARPGSPLRMSYRIHSDERSRLVELRKEIKSIFRGLPTALIKAAEDNRRIAHACGTCRFGLKPERSVLNAHNRAHDLDNLYVVDASFLPSSGSVNPALTIAANAMRVAELMGKKPA